MMAFIKHVDARYFKDLREDLEEANAEGSDLSYFLNKLAVFIAQKCTKRFFKRKYFKLH